MEEIQTLTLATSAWKGLSILLAQKAKILPPAEMQAMGKGGSKRDLQALIENIAMPHVKHRCCTVRT